ncbi:chromosome partitioning protein, ParB family [Streptomyces zhaozhouensis]|uniref:Chromosome partitioning protein, ParB family n=1 Tax=Streptomyces zhaozhouensis TaxID=1300267 RepID=A0A286E887_9ACTN|nr:ParB/RepB/Spo0J family partition protein [Streptomyces zhaozhouensis]SOD67101.1 chromosome partitioning protein, ParB family [Streptomyces zhaozhouensis]
MSSKADRLGSGSFGAAGRSARGRAKAVAQGDVPSYELVRLRLSEVAPTPLNPRRNFGSEQDLARFGEELRQAQLAACVAVTRQTYLRLWPDHEDQIGAAGHVLLNGERRYRGGLAAQLESLDFVVRDDLAGSREDFVDQLLAENLDREDFDVIERARGVQELVDACSADGARGARSRAAERLGRDRSWVTNQLALLTLPEELQVMLSSGKISERDGRALARVLKEQPALTSEDLLESLKQWKTAGAEERAQERAIVAAAQDEKRLPGDALGLLSADNKPGSPGQGLRKRADRAASASGGDEESPGQAPAGLLSADNKPSPPVPEEAGALPWKSPQAIADLVRRYMTAEDVQSLVKLLEE